MRNVNLIGDHPMRKRKLTAAYVKGHKVRRRRPANDQFRLKAIGNACSPQQAEVAGIWCLMLMTSDVIDDLRRM